MDVTLLRFFHFCMVEGHGGCLFVGDVWWSRRRWRRASIACQIPVSSSKFENVLCCVILARVYDRVLVRVVVLVHAPVPDLDLVLSVCCSCLFVTVSLYCFFYQWLCLIKHVFPVLSVCLASCLHLFLLFRFPSSILVHLLSSLFHIPSSSLSPLIFSVPSPFGPRPSSSDELTKRGPAALLILTCAATYVLHGTGRNPNYGRAAPYRQKTLYACS